MVRLLAFLIVGLIGSVAAASAAVKPHLPLFKTEAAARVRCPNDQIVWVSTASHTMYLPSDKHYAHTHGGYACEADGRAHGYHGPIAHA